jgi:hypothetical protein
MVWNWTPRPSRIRAAPHVRDWIARLGFAPEPFALGRAISGERGTTGDRRTYQRTINPRSTGSTGGYYVLCFVTGVVHLPFEHTWPEWQHRLLQQTPEPQQTLLQQQAPCLQSLSCLHFEPSARATPGLLSEANAATASPRRICAQARRRGMGLAKVRATSSNKLFLFMH